MAAARPQSPLDPSASAEEALRLPRADAETLLRAKALAAALPDDASRRQVTEEAASQARHACGERASEAQLAAEWGRRAETLCCERLAAAGAQAPAFPALHLPAKPALAAAALAGFAAGALADQWSGNGRLVNLLAFPFLGLVLWNAAAYLLFIVRLFAGGRRPTVRLDFIRRAIMQLMAALSRSASRLGLARQDAEEKRAAAIYAAEAAAARRDELAALTSAVMHLAAAMLAIGLIASIGIRGIGTAYAVGWESTWFADSPETVAALLRAAYGWLPLPPAVDFSASAIEALRLPADGAHDAALGAASASAAAAWLLRLIETLLFFIALPRLALCAASLLRMKKAAASWQVAVPASLSEALRRQLAHEAWILLAPPADQTAPLAELAVQALGCAPDGIRVHAFSPWDEEAEAPADAAAEGRRLAVWQRIDETPEEDVHGEAILRIRRGASSPILMLLDCRHVAVRFGADSARVRERLALWEGFARQHGAEPIAIKAPAA